jgi:hypothetical protein
MPEELEVGFDLANSASVEIIETSHNRDLGSEAEQDFSHTACGGFLGRLATRELPRDIGQEIKEKLEKPGPLLEMAPVKLLQIPHHFSVRRADNNRLRNVSSVGVIVDYLPEDQTFSIVDLLPNASFRKVFETRATGKVEVAFSADTNSFVPSSLQAIVAGNSAKAEAGFKYEMDFGNAYFASEIQTVGIGTTTAVFEFFRGNEPLEGHDLIAWSIIAVNKYSVELTYRIRLFYTSRVGFIPKHCESDWIDSRIRIG